MSTNPVPYYTYCHFPGYQAQPGIPEDDYLDWMNLRLSWSEIKLNLPNMPPGLKIETRSKCTFIVRQEKRGQFMVNRIVEFPDDLSK